MTNIRWLAPEDGPEALPSPLEALREPNGLLAAGGSLDPQWLLACYSRGIFPWYESGQPILWWSPDPRSVLRPDEVRVSRSLAKTIRQNNITITADTAFDEVVAGCAQPRRPARGTWITTEMAAAYSRLHRLGGAHSFEAWREGELAGGLYGGALGRAFFGESMFTRVRDASKIAFVKSCRFLTHQGCALIDCQMPTAHLHRLGAREISRERFLGELVGLIDPAGDPGSWAERFAGTESQRDAG